MIHKIPELLHQEIEKYFHLKIGGKDVACPYFINSKLSAGSLRVMAGKGEPEEIELEIKIWAKVKNFDLYNTTPVEIRKFMQKMHIGIDCSGLLANVFEKYLIASRGEHLLKFLKFTDNSFLSRFRRFLRPIENIGADVLTSELNCFKVEDINKIKPGDLIRSKGKQSNSHHLALVSEVYIDEGKIVKFQYVNSHSEYADQNGVRYGEVIVTNPQGDLKDQHWLDTYEGRNYFYEGLLVNYEDNGIRRLKSLDLESS